MSSVDRQNKLIVAEDWKRIYQSFKNADFQSYDFDNLRRTMITYLRENYPEDFNDYIESSEYLALIDLIAFLGQNLAFRFDLNARDNFLELAERRESVLRLARLLSYNAKRNQCANGLLKFTSVSTTETIFDSNGRNLSNQTIVWNDSANNNWYEQFIKVVNAAMPAESQFGRPQDSAVISGIATEQYRFNGVNTEVPIYTFNKNIDGRNLDFEVTSASFKSADKIYEEPPMPGTNLAFLYRDDGAGAASSNSGFFVHFRQGSLQETSFKITRPSTNQTIDIDTSNVNNEDVWLYSLDSLGIETDLWTKVDAVEGNNVIYNSVSKNVRKIYSVLSRSNDRIRLVFADGVFGDLPQGNFKAYYRTSNGLTYSINPTDIRNVTINVPYISAVGKQESLTVTLGLKYTVNNATAAESSDDIKTNAPATYYTQGRMITGEDYNILPLSVNQEIVKVKSINRVSSGISRYFDLKDTSGKYSTTNLFGTDGILYKERYKDTTTFSIATRTDIENSVVNKIEPILAERSVNDFYLDAFPTISLGDSYLFKQATSATNISTGSIIDSNDDTYKKVGSYTLSNLKYIVSGAIVKFIPPIGYAFKGNATVLIDENDLEQRPYIWSKVVQVVGDGTASNSGILDNNLGPITFNDVIPKNARLSLVIPKFVTALEDSVKAKLVDLIFARKEFGLRYDVPSTSWKIITGSNINKKAAFSLGRQGDSSNQQLDSSWIILAETDGEVYTITNLATRYVFESQQEIRFFFDSSDKVYDTALGKIIRDKITVLGINRKPDALIPFNQDFDWEIVGDYKGADGYVDTKKISISFYDFDEDGVVDNPELFNEIVSPPDLEQVTDSVELTKKYIFQQRRVSLDGVIDYYYVENTNNSLIKVYKTEGDAIAASLSTGQLVYIIDEDVIKTNAGFKYEINTEYRGFLGRTNLKFQYLHAADVSVRIDPAATNIIDVFMLTKTYDTQYKLWLKNEISTRPLPPSSDALYINFGNQLDKVKSISDEIIYHPVKYKNLFGSKADSALQATFKVVKSSSVVVSDNDVKVGVITAINEFFSTENWDFGDTFYFGELATYVMKKMSPNIANIVIVPKQENLAFGSLYEIKSNSDEIFASSATVDDVEIVAEITATRIKASGTVSTNTSGSNNSITSA